MYFTSKVIFTSEMSEKQQIFEFLANVSKLRFDFLSCFLAIEKCILCKYL